MGVSLQIYRISIGAFNLVGIKINKIRGVRKPTIEKYSNKVAVFIAVLSCLLSISIISSSYETGQVYPQQVGYKFSLELELESKYLRSSAYLDTPKRLSSRDRNFFAKMINGNRGNRGIGIKAIHWNKGSSYLTNMMDEIEAVVADHSPHVLGLSEATHI